MRIEVAALVALASLGAACDLTEPDVARERTMLVIRGPEGTAAIRQIRSRDEVPLRGPRVEAQAGDFMITNGSMVAVVSKADGEIIDLGPEGALDALNAITPALFDPVGQARAAVVFMGIDPDTPNALHIVKRSALPVRLHTFVTFRGDVLVMESTVEPENIADSGMLVSLGERVGFGNFPTWVQGVGFARRDSVNDPASFVAKEGKETSYAVAVLGARSMVRIGSQYLPGYYSAGRGSETILATAGDKSGRRTVLVATSDRSIGDAAQKLFDPASMQRLEGPRGLPPEARVEVAECPVPGSKPEDPPEKERRPYARFRPGEPLVIPATGCFEVRAAAFGHAASEWAPIAKASSVTLPPSGSLVVSVSDKDKPAIARIQVRGVGPTSNPDWGDDPEDGTAVNVAHVKDGALQRPVPPGRYRVIADRGFEYTASEKMVDVRAGETTYVSLSIERVVDTKGWISADLHLHAEPSFDAPQPLDSRILGLAASGVEVGVATDHNRVTDYTPVISALGLKSAFRSVVGDEVTTDEMAFGHFNVFPLEPGSAPLGYRRTSPSGILDEARSRAPYGKDTVVQVNHPRMGDIGYFDVLRFDRDDIPSFQKRSPWARLDFDAIEIFNGDDVPSPSVVRSIMKDWFALIDGGHFITATGNSDSHRLTFNEPGLPRTYVEVPNDDPASLDERAFVEALRRGRAMVSTGPFIRFDVGGAGIGGRVRAGKREAHVTVDAPPWVDVSFIEIVKRGKVVARAEAPFATTAHAAELTASLDLAPDDWVIAIAGGTKEMEVLFRRGVPPFAFTNPVFVGP